MDCLYPLRVPVKYKTKDGLINPNDKSYVSVPCGKCIACRIAKVRDWSIRLVHECSSWSDCSFITLTYDDDHIPLTNCGRVTLVKSDLQKFFKRLRKALPYPIKYFACGEYGGNTGRPHYHAIVFGLPIDSKAILTKCWSKGFNVIEYVTPARCRYVCGYVEKKMYYDPKDFFKTYGCSFPPFQLMSQGLGLNFYMSHREEYLSNLRNTLNGVSYSFPRYYTKKDSVLKYALQKKGRDTSFEHLVKVDSISGSDFQESEFQRERNLKAKSKLKKGKL